AVQHPRDGGLADPGPRRDVGDGDRHLAILSVRALSGKRAFSGTGCGTGSGTLKPIADSGVNNIDVTKANALATLVGACRGLPTPGTWCLLSSIRRCVCGRTGGSSRPSASPAVNDRKDLPVDTLSRPWRRRAPMDARVLSAAGSWCPGSAGCP